MTGPLGFGYDQQDHGPRVPATAPPSRPPSRTNMIDASQPPDYEKATAQPSQGNTGQETPPNNHCSSDTDGLLQAMRAQDRTRK